MKKTDKQVTFAPDTKMENGFTSLAKPHASAVKKLWLHRIVEDNNIQLKNDLILFKNRGLSIGSFFKSHGANILVLALYEGSKEAFAFICENVPADVVDEILSKDDYSMLNQFIITASGREKLRTIDEEELEQQFNKIKLLLSIGSNGVRECFENNLLKLKITEGVKKQTEKALAETHLSYGSSNF